MRLMRGESSKRSASPAISRISTTSMRASYAQARSSRLCTVVRAVRHRSERALLADDMVQNFAPAKAWNDDGVGRQRVGARSHGYDETIVDVRRRMSPTGSKAYWGTIMSGRAASDRSSAHGMSASRRSRDERRSSPGGGLRDRCARHRRGSDCREAGRRMDGSPMAEEGGAAVVPAKSDGSDRRRPRRGALVGQGALEVRGLGREGIRCRGFPRGSRERSSAAALLSRLAQC